MFVVSQRPASHVTRGSSRPTTRRSPPSGATATNSCKNAAEAVPERGGVIELVTAYQHGVRLALPGGARRVHLPLVVSVRDNGAGIPEAIRSSLFDPFVTGKRSGTGLGLALVAKLVGDHGGLVECESRPGRTVFRVHLPIEPPHSRAEEP